MWSAACIYAITFVHLVHVRSAVVSPIRRHLAKTEPFYMWSINKRSHNCTRAVIVTLLPFTLLESHRRCWLPSHPIQIKRYTVSASTTFDADHGGALLCVCMARQNPSSVYILVAGRKRYGKHHITPHIADAPSGRP